jgi:ABC-type glycerol-3-phosphate transport system substrate-binding protein
MVKQKKLTRRDFLKLAGVTAGTSVLAACAPVATQQQPAAAVETKEEAPPAEAVTLRYRTWHTRESSPGDNEWYDWLAETYPQEEAPGTTLEFEFVGFGAEYIQKVLADSAAGTPPDLLHSSIIWARDFYDRGVLRELDDYLAPVAELAPDQFYGDATNEYRSKAGKYYGVPWEGPDSAIYAINMDLAEEAGLDPTGQEIKTWDDFTAAAQAMTKVENGEMVQAGTLIGSHRSIEQFNGLLTANGGAIANEDFTEPAFNNDRAVQLMEWQLQLLDEVSFPISPERQDTQLFLQGQVGIIQAGTWSTTNFTDTSPEGFRYDFFMFPQGPQGDGEHASTTWSNMFVLPQKTDNPDAAFNLMRYCTTPPVVIKRFEFSTRTTPHKSIFESAKWDEVLEKYPQKWIVIPAAQAGSVYPFFPFFTEANDAIGVELEKIMIGEKGIEEGLTDAEAAVMEVITRRTAG